MLRDDTAGVVVTTTSGFAPGERKAFDEIRRRGVVVVTCFPSGDHVSPAFREWRHTENKATLNKENNHDGKEQVESLPPMIRASHLLPAKARILLMCALTKTRDPTQIQEYFSLY